MKASKIIEVLELRLQKLQKHLFKLPECFDPEELHDYRLEMKKIKAFLHLINTAIGEKKHVHIGASMKDFYRLTGDVRNIELYQKRIEGAVNDNKLEVPKAYLQMLAQERKYAMEQLQVMAKHFPFDAFKKKILQEAPRKLDEEDIKSYLMQQRHALVSLLFQPIHTDEALHQIRKQVKEIGYNRNYLGSHLSIFLPIDFMSKEQTDQLAEKLGSYNDICVSIGFLQSFGSNCINSQEEQSVLQCVKMRIANSKLEMKADVEKHLLTTLKGSY